MKESDGTIIRQYTSIRYVVREINDLIDNYATFKFRVISIEDESELLVRFCLNFRAIDCRFGC